MSGVARRWVLACLLALGAREAAALAALDAADRALRWESPGRQVRLDLGGRLDVEGYWVDRRPPGLVFGGGDDVVAPRLVLTLDAWLGRRVYGFVQARADRGFDPLLAPDGDARADEYFLRWTPFDGGGLHVQVGKFATLVGNWVARHDAWQNPFVTAPLPYERVTAIGDDAAADSQAAFRARRDLPDKKRKWLPVVWGPSYASGVALAGRAGPLDYGAEVKNAALGSRPSQWDAADRDPGEPTASARLGVRPSAAWALGVSGSAGPYLRHDAEASLPRRDDTGDFRQFLLAADARWAWRHLEVWAEAFGARFEVPIACPRCRRARVVDADTLAYYLEGRWRATPRLFAALRWNQQVFGDVAAPGGRDVAWDRDAWRADAALTWRVDRHVQAKVQYGIGRQNGRLQQGEQLVAGQVSVRF